MMCAEVGERPGFGNNNGNNNDGEGGGGEGGGNNNDEQGENMGEGAKKWPRLLWNLLDEMNEDVDNDGIPNSQDPNPNVANGRSR